MENPFSSLKIDDSSFLHDQERQYCQCCGKSRMYLCYTCNVPVHDSLKTPKLKLPYQFDIIKHPREYMGKSTSPQAVILAPEECTLHTYPKIPLYDSNKTLLLYPGQEAKPLSFFFIDKAKNIDPDNNDSSFNRVVVIDATWRQAQSIVKHKALNELPVVKLSEHRTNYWRFHKDNPSTCLSTIEAIYYFCVEHFQLTHDPLNTPYDGRYDNLLFYFSFFHQQMRELVQTKGKSFQAFMAREFMSDAFITK
ncbi:DTW domain-containing protein 1 [Fasciola gigantica]|uniref:tRNA-uridine aminocarboxypropyltransferase 1 n=1 Tax=Fasciola gigantica TaxID=46835 RepID=A0A504Y905_FASGI|nr:DTW domain-containing protein 1 [Fasciola gigantica]